MADEIKFSDEELKSLQDLSQSYQNIQASFGQLKVQKILNQQQSEALEEAEVKMDADYKDIQDMGGNRWDTSSLLRRLKEL